MGKCPNTISVLMPTEKLSAGKLLRWWLIFFSNLRLVALIEMLMNRVIIEVTKPI